MLAVNTAAVSVKSGSVRASHLSPGTAAILNVFYDHSCAKLISTLHRIILKVKTFTHSLTFLHTYLNVWVWSGLHGGVISPHRAPASEAAGPLLWRKSTLITGTITARMEADAQQ